MHPVVVTRSRWSMRQPHSSARRATARERGQHAADALEGEELRRGARRTEGHHARVGGVGEHRVGEIVHFDVERALGRSRWLGLLHGGGAAAHVIARLRPRLDDADVLEALVRLQHRGNADALLVREAPHRRHAIARAQRAGADQFVNLVGELVIERRRFQHAAILPRRLYRGQTQLAAPPAITVGKERRLLPAQFTGREAVRELRPFLR
jgi:hypothetical protein